LLLPLLLAALGACEEPSADEFIRRAEAYRQEGNVAASIIELKNALQQQPRNAEARFLLGQSYLTVRDFVGAEKELLRARDYGFEPERLVEPLAEVWLTGRQFEKVLEELRVRDSASPAEKAAVALARARAHRGLGRLDESEADFRSVLAHDPDSVAALVGLARIAFQRGDDSLAESSIAHAFEFAPEDLGVLALKGDHAFLREDYPAAEAHYQAIAKLRPNNIAVRLALARAQISLGKPEQAVANLDAVLRFAKGHPDANYLRASLALEAGDYFAASLHSEQVLLTHPNHTPSLLIAGIASYALGQLARAERHLSRVLDEDPGHDLARRLHGATQTRLARAQDPGRAFRPLLDDSVEPRHLLAAFDPITRDRRDREAGRAYFESISAEHAEAVLPNRQARTAELDAQRSQLRSALAQAPRDVRVLARLAQLETQLGNMEQAASFLETAIAADPYAVVPRALLGQLHLREARPTKALEVARVALRDQPQHAVLLGLVGLAQLQAGRIQQAKLGFRSLVDAKPGSASAHYLLALAYEAEGDSALYKDWLDRVLALDPGHLRARVGVVRWMAQEGALDAARDMADGLLDGLPENAGVLDLAGGIALLQGRAEDAVALFQRAVVREPTATALLKLAYAQQRAGNGERSRASLLRWLAGVPDDTDARLVLANKYLAAGDLERARFHYARGILLAPNNVVALNNLAWVSLKMGHPEAALGYAQRAFQLEPDEPRVIDTLGLAQLGSGNAAAAVSALRRAHNRAPESLQIQVHLAQALAERGQAVEAREILRRLLSQGRDFPEEQDAETLLRELGG
jgi:tetratricopeptide (TPR) repeat protein